MLALYFVARRYRWRYLKALMYGSLLLGFVYGTWHYMSHTFWAGIFVWLACVLKALAFYGRARLARPVRDGRFSRAKKSPRESGQTVVS